MKKTVYERIKNFWKAMFVICIVAVAILYTHLTVVAAKTSSVDGSDIVKNPMLMNDIRLSGSQVCSYVKASRSDSAIEKFIIEIQDPDTKEFRNIVLNNEEDFEALSLVPFNAIYMIQVDNSNESKCIVSFQLEET